MFVHATLATNMHLNKKTIPMKKLLLLLAATAFAVISCNSDDDANPRVLSANYLKGTWIETAPAQSHQLDFTETTATLKYLTGSGTNAYAYTVQDSTLHLSAPESDYISTHDIEIVNSTTFKITSIYPYYTCNTCEDVTSTFVKVLDE